MTNHNSGPASRLELSPDDRLKFIRYLNQLPEPQFEELLYALGPPFGVVPGKNAPQGNRVSSLLAWIEGSTGPGIQRLKQLIENPDFQESLPRAERKPEHPATLVTLKQRANPFGCLLPLLLTLIFTTAAGIFLWSRYFKQPPDPILPNGNKPDTVIEETTGESDITPIAGSETCSPLIPNGPLGEVKGGQCIYDNPSNASCSAISANCDDVYGENKCRCSITQE